MDMGSLGLAQLGCQPAFEAKGGELCRKFDHQYRIGKAPERIGAIDTTGDEQKRQTRGEAQQKTEYIGPSAFRQRSNIVLALVSGRFAIDWRCQPCLMIQDCSNRSPAGPLKGTLSIAVSGICHHNGLPVYLRSETSGLFMSCVTTD